MPDINVIQIKLPSLSAFYGLFAVGLALVFGIMKVVEAESSRIGPGR